MLNLTINKPRNSNKIKLAPSSSFGIQVRSSVEHEDNSASSTQIVISAVSVLIAISALHNQAAPVRCYRLLHSTAI